MRDQEQYFANRNVNPEIYREYEIPCYLSKVLPSDKCAQVLDIGCGLGQTLIALRNIGYKSLQGIDILNASVDYCRQNGLNVTKIPDIISYAKASEMRFDFLIMSHVLEHINKNEIIPTLSHIRKDLIKDGGRMVLMVPNAQSNTNCYWAYEDFTHTTLFTAGSLSYVLKAAGFQDVVFLDPKGTDGMGISRKIVTELLMRIYLLNKKFWNKVTRSDYYRPSPNIFTMELKVLTF